MGDIQGFKKHKRALPKNEIAENRIRHFKEFKKPFEEKKTIEQASRCMECGVPFCHNGCPLGNLIPDFNDAVYKEEWYEAYKILQETNNFPEFTGRICPAPCEASCVLNINSEAVTIEHIEKSIIEKAFEEGWVKPNTPKTKNESKIAIIGSGPAGMACADELNKYGYKVHLFERNDKIGGLLRYGIPDFKLAKSIVKRRVDLMIKSGIKMHTKINVGIDITAKELNEEYDAIVLTGGSTIARDLPVEGRNLNGVHFAMEYLEQQNKVVDGKVFHENELINVTNKYVVVIGGGDTGADCVGTSNRLNAKSVSQLELMSKPLTFRQEDDLWPNWPMTLRTSTSHEEGCDRKWAVTTKRFLSQDGENLSGLELVDVEWQKDESGAYKMKELEGSKKIIPCTIAFLAIGFKHPQKEGILEQLNVALDERGNVFTDNFRTSVEKVYAAGDMRRGQSLVVWAIAEGKQAAQVIHKDFGAEKLSYRLD